MSTIEAVDRKRRHKTDTPGIYYRLDARERRRYIVWYQDSAGAGRMETLPLGATLKDARARQAELRSRLARGEKIAPTKITLKEYADVWLEEQRAGLAKKSFESYRSALNTHVLPRLGRLKVQEVDVDDVARLVREMQADGKKAWTIRGALSPLSRIMGQAARRGMVAGNPVKALERHERPKSDQRRMRILSSAEIERLLTAAPAGYRPLLTCLVFTGMRISEALAVRWVDVDFDRGLLTVRDGKTAAAAREIVLMPSLGRVLRAHKLASRFSQEGDLVFASRITGGSTSRKPVGVGLGRALEKAELGHLTLHELRHTFASILIGQGMDVTFVADQLGHSTPAVTLSTYAKLFDPASRRDEARTLLEAAFGGLL